jgi:hypothetical protein
MNINGYNAAWQYPARTEYAAYVAARQLDYGDLKNFTYIGFPWATLIDSFQSSRVNRWEGGLQFATVDATYGVSSSADWWRPLPEEFGRIAHLVPG